MSELISKDCRDAFVAAGRLLMQGGLGVEHWDVVDSMARHGIRTIHTGNDRNGVPVESTLSVADRFEGYFATVDWSNREAARKVVPVFEEIARLISWHNRREYLDSIVYELARDSLKLNATGCIVKSNDPLPVPKSFVQEDLDYIRVTMGAEVNSKGLIVRRVPCPDSATSD